MEEEVYIDFKNGQGPYISDTQLNQLQKLIKADIKNKVLESLKLAFPIGQPYITQSNTNPSTILGFGTWERVKGKVLVGLDEDDADEYFDEIGKEGGEKKHTLTVDEIPAHSHTIRNGSNGLDGGSDWAVSNSGSSNWQTANAGGGQAHNNLQPYKVVGYMWIRTA